MNELKRFKELLSPDYSACTERVVEDEEDLHSVREGALKITLHVLKSMNHKDLANTLQNSKSSEHCIYYLHFDLIHAYTLHHSTFKFWILIDQKVLINFL